jgi:holo-[acyl-carrier protein] synthase
VNGSVDEYHWRTSASDKTDPCMKIIGIGVDVVEIVRIAGSIERHGDRFLRRVFTDQEQEYCGALKHAAQSYAARFAAKEAVSKAFGTGIGANLGWLDIEVRRKPTGEPYALLHGAGAALAKRLGVTDVLLSLSHSEHYAVANAVVIGD